MTQNQNSGGQNSDGQNQNSGQSGKKKQTQNFPKCPVCGIRPLPKERVACLICSPIYRIDAKLARGKSGWQIIVQTYENSVQVKVSFAMDISNKNVLIISATQKTYWKDDGLAIVPLKFSDQDRKASFHIIGGPADISDLDIPAEKPKSAWKKPEKGKGFWHNLTRRGES